MEYGLGPSLKSTTRSHALVLILVLMEYGLGLHSNFTLL